MFKIEMIKMPVRKCSNGKWSIGDGACVFKTKQAAEKAYAVYRAKKNIK